MKFNQNTRLVKVMGGLGNQLFQYCFGQALAAQGLDVLYDVSWYDGCADHTGFELASLISPERRLASEGMRDWKKHEKKKKLARRLRLNGSWSSAFKEGDSGYCPEALACDSIRYEGYWQSWKYLEYCPQAALDQVSKLISERARKENIPSGVDAEQTVVMHIRRGDYYAKPDAAITHAVPLESYYRRAIHELVDDESRYQFFIYSDDPDPLQYFPSIRLSNVKICSSRLSDPYTDLWSMSLARNLIIANSSYSWWAAYLTRERASVCAPNKWFNDRPIDLDDLFPAHWRRVPVE